MTKSKKLYSSALFLLLLLLLVGCASCYAENQSEMIEVPTATLMQLEQNNQKALSEMKKVKKQLKTSNEKLQESEQELSTLMKQSNKVERELTEQLNALKKTNEYFESYSEAVKAEQRRIKRQRDLIAMIAIGIAYKALK